MFRFPNQEILFHGAPWTEVQELKALSEIKAVVFDFDGVFTDNSVYVDQNGTESVRCSRLDGFGISALRDLGLILLVLSTEQNPVVSARCKKLKLECYQGVSDKAVFLTNHLANLKITAAHVAYVGNDINDIGCLELVGFPIIVADAHPSVNSRAKYVTQSVGGHGAVREICDFIAASRINQKARP